MPPNTQSNSPAEAPNAHTQETIEEELASLQDLIDNSDRDADDSLDDTPLDPLPSSSSPDSATLAAETEAGGKGWVPKAAYKGDPAKWVDAKTFLARGERFTVNLQKELAEVKAQLESFQGTKAAFIKFHEETLAKKDADLRDAIAALRIQRSQATADGEHDVAVEIEDRIELLKDQRTELKATPAVKEQPAPAHNGPDMNNPVMLEWIDDGHEWFRDDPQLQLYAVEIGNTLRTQGNKLMGRAFLDTVAAQVHADFPRRFKQNGKAQAGNTEGAGNAGSNSGKQAYNGKTERDLPPADLRLMREFIADGYTTKEKFLTSYFARNG